MTCPSCKIELKMSERNNIEIDYCPECRGVWLDRGELDKIIERSNESLNPSSKEYRRDHDSAYKTKDYIDMIKHRSDDKYHGHKRRKSFLGELFDF
ncbi:MAG: hypothetical protein EYC69_05730 [Bacteroidetes bacterium]|nr:MAG: hypothetical protein EYC69_05730 [Bacteroidota bacterium]